MVSTMNPGLLRSLMALGLFAGTMLFSMIPVILARKAHADSRGVKSVISALSCLGGGVFLGTLMLHLLPEASEKMNEALEGYDIHFPVPFAIMIGGFLLVLVSEQVRQQLESEVTSFHSS